MEHLPGLSGAFEQIENGGRLVHKTKVSSPVVDVAGRRPGVNEGSIAKCLRGNGGKPAIAQRVMMSQRGEYRHGLRCQRIHNLRRIRGFVFLLHVVANESLHVRRVRRLGRNILECDARHVEDLAVDILERLAGVGLRASGVRRFAGGHNAPIDRPVR